MDAYKNRQRILTLDEARVRVAYWQRRFRLTDWAISVEIVRASKLATPTQLLLGHVEILDVKQIAVVRLLDPIDFIADVGFIPEQDMELTLIHELLHVRLHDMKMEARNSKDSLCEERTIHAVSMMLTELDDAQSVHPA